MVKKCTILESDVDNRGAVYACVETEGVWGISVPLNFVVNLNCSLKSKSYKKHPKEISWLFTIARTQKQPKFPPVDEWIKKIGHIHTMECYPAFKKREILSFTTTWMSLEDNMLS